MKFILQLLRKDGKEILVKRELRELNISNNHFLAHQISAKEDFDYYLILEDDSSPKLSVSEFRTLLLQLLELASHVEKCSGNAIFCDLSHAFPLDVLGLNKEEFFGDSCVCGTDIIKFLPFRQLIIPGTNTVSAVLYNRAFSEWVAPVIIKSSRQLHLRTLPIDMLTNVTFLSMNMKRISILLAKKTIFLQRSLSAE